MAKRRDIGLKVQDVEIGKTVYYYEWVGEFENSEPQETRITGNACEICGSLCCMIDIRTSVVCLDNLSFEPVPKTVMTRKKAQAKERYSKYANADSEYDGISFRDYLKYRMYEDD